ncbi:MAG: peptidylprolyl isomerase [Elusimicrobia bacterium]|nr:peptidylprolyl isomerase [Elusimicrobiota bacterium]
MKVLNRIWGFKLKNYSIVSAVLTASAVMLSGAEVLEKTVATVNGEALYQSDFEANVGNVLDDLRRAAPGELMDAQVEEIRSKVLAQMIDDLLLLQESKRRGVKVYAKDIETGVAEVKNRFKKDEEGRPVAEADADKAFQAELRRQRLSLTDFEERIKKQLHVIKLVDTQVKSKVEMPSENEVRSFFDQVKGVVASSAAAGNLRVGEEERQEILKLAQLFRDRTTERVRARHILIKVGPKAPMAEKSKALSALKSIKKEADAGADFAELARKHSQDTESAKKGGDLGYFIKGWMVPEFEQAAFSLPVGDVSNPVETEFGYHLILVEEKRAKTPLRFDEVQEDLASYLQQRNFQKKLKDLVDGLRVKATIKVLNDPAKTTSAP